MIVLSNSPKVLFPVSAKEWRQPSQRSGLYQIENQTRFRLSARANDGAVIWRGWFDDRDDADAFLYAMMTGSLKREKELWDLPTETWMPNYGYGDVKWRPDLGENLSYEFLTTSFLTSTSASNQTYNVPSDWNSGSNSVETIGSGGGGNTGIADTNGGTISGASGGGGGGYSKQTNITLTAGGTATFHLEAGGATATAGGDCWFNGTTLAGSSVGAKGGGAGAITLGTTVNGGSGGASASGVGATKNSGGRGGNISNNNYRAGSGGGGAAGPSGAGAAGGDGSSNGVVGGTGGGGSNNGSQGSQGSGVQNPASGGNGGNGGGGTGGGTGGTGVGGNGTAGTGGAGAGGGFTTQAFNGGNGSIDQAFDSTHGAGAGAGGSGSASTTTTANSGGTAGTYGGGGGGGSSCNTGGTAGTGSAGGQGLIYITYTPATYIFPNMPVLGM